MKNLSFILISLLATTSYAQNVGIGTPTPTEKLHVVGGTRITGLGGAGNALVLTDNQGVLYTLVFSGTANDVLTGDGLWTPIASLNSDWQLSGNAGTNPATNFVGTTDNQDLVFRTNNTEKVRIHTSGNVDIGANLDDARVYARILNTDNTTNHGIYSYHDGAVTGTTYGIRSNNYSSTNSTKYGIYSRVNNEGTGVRYGIYNYVTMNTESTSAGCGIYNNMYAYAAASSVQAHYGIRTYLFSDGDGTGNLYGMWTEVDDDRASTHYGSWVNMESSTNYDSENYAFYSISDGAGDGNIHGNYNYISNTGNGEKYGTYNDIVATGTGAHYGIYSNTPGGTNDFAAVFNAGNVVANEVGGNYDFRIEADTRTHALWVDANENIVRFGTANAGSDFNNGAVISGTTVDYVADFDHGIGASGTAVGIGSIEYLLDGANMTMINNEFSPTNHIIYDLGFSTTLNGWDDVYADNFVNISDRREKHNIQEIQYGLEEVLQMRPVSYVLNKDPFGETKLGLIAQEALVLVPESVKTHDYKFLDEQAKEPTKVELERMGMTYNALIPVLIKATQDQQEIIETLEQRIERLEKVIEEMTK